MKQWFNSLSPGAKIAWIIGAMVVFPTTGAILGANYTPPPAQSTTEKSEVLSATATPAPTATPRLTSTPTATPSPTPTPSAVKQTPAPTISRSTPTPISTATPALSNDNYYTNSDGSQVHSPAYSQDNSVPAGATAICGDGTYSFSQSRRGTCSHHGGVSQWL